MPRFSDPSFVWLNFLGPEDSRYVVFELSVEGPKANYWLSSEVICDKIPLFQFKWIYYKSEECNDIVDVYIPINREFEFRELLTAKSPELIPETVTITIKNIQYKDYKHVLARNEMFYRNLVAESKKKISLDTALSTLSTVHPDAENTQRGWLISMASDHYKPNPVHASYLATVFSEPSVVINYFNQLHFCTLNDHPCLANEASWSISNVTIDATQLRNMKPGCSIRVFELDYGKLGVRKKVLCTVTCLAIR